MISPRKKIEQSTGRILRTQKDVREIPPLIIDLVDMHSVYMGQWCKRKVYYKKCAYKIQDVGAEYALPTGDLQLQLQLQPKVKEAITNKYMFED